MPTWTAVTADWTAATGQGFMALFEGGFLQSGKVLADGYPCIRTPPCGCYHARVGSTLRMACTCEEPDCRDFTVTEEQLRLHSLNTLRLADALRRVLSVKGPSRAVRDIPSVYALGTYHPAPQASHPVFLLAPSADGDQLAALAELVLSHDKKVGIVLLSRAGLDARLEKSLAGQAYFIFLPETATVTATGGFELLPGVKDPLRPIHTSKTSELTEDQLVLAVQAAFAIDDEKERRSGPNMITYLRAVARDLGRNQIARDFDCSPAQISGLKKEFRERTGHNPELLAGRIGDLDRVAKTISDSRARHIDQRTAATGREEDFES
jgi:hypothetical protein